jgi:hypothetical protein
MDSEGGRWVYRRMRAIGGPIARLGRRTPDGLPHLAPEIQLLYKAGTHILPKDQQGPEVALPLLGRWQKACLGKPPTMQFDGGHPWIDRWARWVGPTASAQPLEAVDSGGAEWDSHCTW